MISFLLLLFIFALPTQACNEQSACLYFVACFDQERLELNSTKMIPALEGTMSLKEAIEEKGKCTEFGFAMTLSILSTSISSWNVSFETDLNVVGFDVGLPAELNSLQFYTYAKGNIKLKGIPREFDPSQIASITTPGRTTYSFAVEDPEKLHLQSLIGRNISLAILKRYHFVASQTDLNDFWKDLKSKLACDPSALRDSCRNPTDCDKVIVSSHSVSCANPSELWLESTGGEWSSVSSVECRNEQWKFVFANGTVDGTTGKDINVECRKPASSITTEAPVDSEEYEAAPESVDKPAPAAQEAVDSATTVAAPPAHAKKEEDFPLPGNKWLWIGGVGTLILIIIILIVVLCIVLRKRNKSKAGKKQSKAGKRNNKGGKKNPDSSGAQPSSSESKVDPSSTTKTVQSFNPPPSSESVMQPATVKPGCTTEMNLDVLKTEML